LKTKTKNKIAPEIKSRAEKYKSVLPGIKEVRDMNEHVLEYFESEERRQGEFVKGNRNIAADASADIINGEFIIGNRLSVEKTVAVAEEILPVVTDCLMNLPDEEDADGTELGQLHKNCTILFISK